MIGRPTKHLCFPIRLALARTWLFLRVSRAALSLPTSLRTRRRAQATGQTIKSAERFARALGTTGERYFRLCLIPGFGRYRTRTWRRSSFISVPFRQFAKQWPATKLIFPVNYLIRVVPQPLETPVPEPDLSTPVKRGAYLVRVAGCGDCHTPQDSHGRPLPGLDFAGGQVFKGPWGQVASENITPDASGLPYEALYTEAMHGGSVKGRPLSSIMPWDAYRRMTDEDSAAIFAYLKTLKPVRHNVDNTQPPTYCKLCRQMHGGGNTN